MAIVLEMQTKWNLKIITVLCSCIRNIGIMVTKSLHSVLLQLHHKSATPNYTIALVVSSLLQFLLKLGYKLLL